MFNLYLGLHKIRTYSLERTQIRISDTTVKIYLRENPVIPFKSYTTAKRLSNGLSSWGFAHAKIKKSRFQSKNLRVRRRYGYHFEWFSKMIFTRFKIWVKFAWWENPRTPEIQPKYDSYCMNFMAEYPYQDLPLSVAEWSL